MRRDVCRAGSVGSSVVKDAIAIVIDRSVGLTPFVCREGANRLVYDAA